MLERLSLEKKKRFPPRTKICFWSVYMCMMLVNLVNILEEFKIYVKFPCASLN